MAKGKFIVIEGLDGCGKSTQAKLLAERLKGHVHVQLDCEPTRSYIGQLIRDRLMHKGTSMQHETHLLALMFAADRMVHCNRIRQDLDDGVWIVCDRYIQSSLAFQGPTVGEDVIWQMNERALHEDVTFLLDVSLDTAKARISARGVDGGSLETDESLRKAFEAYSRMSEKSMRSKAAYHIDSEQRPSVAVHEDIWSVVKEMLP